MKILSLLSSNAPKLRLGLTLLIAILVVSGCAKKYPPGHPSYVGEEKATSSKTAPPKAPKAVSANAVVQQAIKLQGAPYKAGGTDPQNGFDCSGFTSYVYLQAAGINLPRSSSEQYQTGRSVSRNKLQPGDLVFFRSNKHSKISHVGIYAQDNKFIHAPTSKGKVRAERLDLPYWKKNYVGARRLLN